MVIIKVNFRPTFKQQMLVLYYIFSPTVESDTVDGKDRRDVLFLSHDVVINISCKKRQGIEMFSPSQSR